MKMDEASSTPLGLAWHLKVGWVGCAVVGYGLITCWKLVCGSLSPFTDLRSLLTRQVRLHTISVSRNIERRARGRRRRRVST
jgi:hypothetical protein